MQSAIFRHALVTFLAVWDELVAAFVAHIARLRGIALVWWRRRRWRRQGRALADVAIACYRKSGHVGVVIDAHTTLVNVDIRAMTILRVAITRAAQVFWGTCLQLILWE